MTLQRNKRNGEIEFWRWIFCVIVFVFHVSLDRAGTYIFFGKGQIGVEFFFLVSGFFMAKKADRERDRDTANLGKESMIYVIRKYLSIFPYHLFVFIAGLFIILYNRHFSLEGLSQTLIYAFPQFFLFHMNGYIFDAKVVSVEWYISSLLIVSLMIYPMLRKFYDKFVFIIAPLASLAVGGYLANKGPLLDAPKWMGLTTMGIFRAILELCLGCIAYEISKYIMEKDFTMFKRVILALINLAGYGIALAFSCSHMNEKVRYIVLLFLMISVAITLSGKNLYGGIFNNGFFRYLGKLSLPFYLNTNIIRFICVKLDLPEISYKKHLVIAVLMNAALCVAVTFVVDMWKKYRLIRKTKKETELKSSVA